MSVKIPQVLSGALGAAVYTCVAQRAGAYLLGTGHDTPDLMHWLGSRPTLIEWVTLVFILLWTTKNLVDDFKAFEHPADASFNLLLTVFFSAVAYSLLALAGSVVFNGQLATQILFLYFATLMAWSLTSWLRRLKSADTSAEAIDKRRRRGRWVLLYAFCAACIVASLRLDIPWLLIGGVGIIYIFDCRNCGTFSSKNDHGI